MTFSSASPTLDVSFIVPCRNERDHIDGCLTSILSFDSAGISFEVLVIDGMSADGTREKLQNWKERDPRIRVLDNPAGNTPAALNIGVVHSKGGRLIRLDAHSVYPQDYLRECMTASLNTGAENVGGYCVTLSRSSNFEGEIIRAITTHRFGVGDAGFRLGPSDGPADTVPFGCFRRDVFEKIGKFDERLIRNQDYEFNRRIIASGGQVWCSSRIKAYYYNQGKIAGLLKQAFVTSLWNPWMWYLAPYTFAYRHLVPAAFVGALIATAAVTLVSPWPLVLLLALYAVPNLASSFQQARRYRRWWLVLVLPWLFTCYHVTYGAGTIYGALRLLIRNSPVQATGEPWPGAGQYRVSPQLQTQESN